MLNKYKITSIGYINQTYKLFKTWLILAFYLDLNKLQ